jgi:carbon monoxide dehydrogenase subunit G
MQATARSSSEVNSRVVASVCRWNGMNYSTRTTGLEITGEYRMRGNRQAIWDVLNDPDKLARAIPGVDRMVVEKPDHYRAEMSVGVGFIRGRFNGTVEIVEKFEPSKFRMVTTGKGVAGSVSGSGTVELNETAANDTTATVNGEVKIGGLLGRAGEKAIGNVANNVMQQFFKNVEKLAASSPQ